MIIKTKDLTSEQVNDIILLVNSNRGKVNASRNEGELIVDLSYLTISEQIQVTKEIKKIQKEQKKMSST